MQTSIVSLLLLALMQPAISLADGYRASSTVVVGGNYGYGPRGGYYGPRGGYYGPGWRPYGGPAVGVYFGSSAGLGLAVGTARVLRATGWSYPSVVTCSPPVVYVEKGDAGVAPVYGSGDSLEPGYWYYCRERGAYYPAVTQCPGRWEKVAPVNN